MSIPVSLSEAIARQRDKVIAYQTSMTAMPALGPDNGGTGELPKALYLEGVLRKLGCTDIERIDAPDARVPGGVRPNIAARIPGASPRTLWIMGHMDVVPTGELSQWKTDPWNVVVEGDRIIGRGVEDNQQAIVCALLVAGELLASGVTPDLSLGLLFVADEETSNTYGIHHVLKTRPDLFKPDDFVVVPDYGVPDGSCIEIAEKGQLWLKVTVKGVQCHASRPQEGHNSLVAAADMILHVRDLEALYPEQNPLFDPSVSTFVPTRHEENVPNINSLPGLDAFYLDCRILPGVSHEAVIASVRAIMEPIAARHEVAVAVSVVQSSEAAPATPSDSEVVRRLAAGIRTVYGVEPRCNGVGGGTVAVGFRRMGIPAAVWASLVPTCHIANEYSLISKTLGDAQVLAGMLFDA
ncbi:MAG: M20 family metallo-hydrolase [Bilophila sp.]